MGEIVGAGLISHVPPLVMPEAIRRELNNGEDTTLFQGLHDLGAQRVAPLGPTPWWWWTPIGSPPSSTS